MMLGTGEGLKGRAAPTGQPAAALDPLTRTPRLAVMLFRKEPCLSGRGFVT